MIRFVLSPEAAKKARPKAAPCTSAANVDTDCAACPGRQGCTNGRARTIVRLFDEDARDHARSLRNTPAYAQSCRERKKVEMPFAHLKRHLKLTRLRLRGLAGASEEFLLKFLAKFPRSTAYRIMYGEV